LWLHKLPGWPTPSLTFISALRLYLRLSPAPKHSPHPINIFNGPVWSRNRNQCCVTQRSASSPFLKVRLDNISSINYGDAENVIAIFVNGESGSGWWYEGAGIYRHVHLVSTSPLHIDLYGVFAPAVVTGALTVRANSSEGVLAASADVHVEVNIANYGLHSSPVCAHSVLFARDGVIGGTANMQGVVAAGGAARLNGTITLSGADGVELWSIPRPYLYTLQTSITACGNAATVLDSVNTTVGVRTLKYLAETGFSMNGQPTKVRGFCDHNDFASVGMAVPDRINLFRAQASRSVGGNGRRTSHNPPNPGMLSIYDRVGVVVMDENRLFANDTNYVFNMGQMVQRDRQHPRLVGLSHR